MTASRSRFDRERLTALLTGFGGALVLIGSVCLGIAPAELVEPTEHAADGAVLAFLEHV